MELCDTLHEAPLALPDLPTSFYQTKKIKQIYQWQ